jgi:hypothetical protein
MKTYFAAATAIALFAAPAFADELNAQSTGGKPSSTINPSTDSAAKNAHSYGLSDPDYESSGAGAGESGADVPTAPEEPQDLEDSGEAPGVHNDPGTTSSPPPEAR